MRDFMSMDCDQADCFLRGQRTQPFLDPAGGKAKTARAYQVDADEVAILGAPGIGLGNVQFAPGLFLVDRNQAPFAARQRAEETLKERPGKITQAEALAELARAGAQLQLLEQLRKRRG